MPQNSNTHKKHQRELSMGRLLLLLLLMLTALFRCLLPMQSTFLYAILFIYISFFLRFVSFLLFLVLLLLLWQLAALLYARLHLLCPAKRQTSSANRCPIANARSTVGNFVCSYAHTHVCVCVDVYALVYISLTSFFGYV